MNQGEVLALGTPAEVQADAKVIEAYLGSTDDLSSLRRVPA
jgi:branched-chain amino acid transport system ATP-binding protein